MIEIALVIGGLFLGWNIPQPEYARKIQVAVIAKYREFRAKK